MKKTDEELVAAYCSGDESAFAVLVERHLKSVYSLAARLVRGDADDIVQDTFLKAWKHLEGFDPRRAQFKTWLMRIARNAIIDSLRKKKPFILSDLESEYGDDRLAEVPDAEPLPDEIVARAHDARAVEEALAGLSPAHREVLLLRYMSQMPFEEISAVIGEPSNTVRSRHRRALEQLRHRLELMHQKSP